MSYDLYLGRRDLPPLDDVERVLRDVPHLSVERKAEDVSAGYFNPATGVYFSLDYGDPLDEEDDADLPPPPLPIVLALNLNFNRAAFFGLECFEVVGPICRELDLLVFDDFEEEPVPFDADEQFDLWDAGNLAAADVLARQSEPPPFMERTRAIEWWRYARRQPELDERFLRENYDVFVPTLMLVHDMRTNHVLRTIAWPEAIPTVVPPVDLLVVQRTAQGRFRRKSEDGIIDASDALPPIEPHLEPLDDDLRILTPDAAARDEVRAAVAAYHLRPLDSSRYVGIEPDGFADLRPEAA